MDFHDTVIDGIRRVANLCPQSTAAQFRDQSLTYSELATRFDGLANLLRSQGVTQNIVVGVHLSRSIEMLIAVLGVLAAGGCYLPMDPEIPTQRLRRFLHDSASKIVLTNEPESELFEDSTVQCIRPSEWPATGMPSKLSNRAAYMIYTSGSTGQPKGVVVEHTALTNYLQWCVSVLNFDGNGVPLFGSIAYDHCLTALFPPLLKGEALHLLGPIHGGHSLADELLSGRSYSYIKITPSHVRMLTVEERAALGRAVGMVVFGGERLQVDLVQQLRRDAPSLPVLNHYGPTEATVGCCAYVIPSNIPENIPIGSPFPGVELSIRNENGEICPHGDVGELYISGRGLARGYWNEVKESRSSFVILAEAEGPRRWYRSGDYVRLRDDGAIEYCGRRDDQIKILGHRVEAAEVENLIRTHPGVIEVAVFGLQHAWGAELVCSVVAQPGVTEAELRNYLRSRAPAAMVPSRISIVPEMSRMGNGKLDRAALVEQNRLSKQVDDGESVESLVLAKWRDALRDQQISPSDDFFEIGGDSMATVEICLWAIGRFGVDLEPTVVFDHPTAESLAAYIRSSVDRKLAAC